MPPPARIAHLERQRCRTGAHRGAPRAPRAPTSVSDGAGFFYFADGNYDGKVDAGDYVVWRNNLGKELPPLAGEATGSGGVAVGSIVPEPASAVLAIVCGAALLARRRRRALAPHRGV